MSLRKKHRGSDSQFAIFKKYWIQFDVPLNIQIALEMLPLWHVKLMIQISEDYNGIKNVSLDNFWMFYMNFEMKLHSHALPGSHYKILRDIQISKF